MWNVECGMWNEICFQEEVIGAKDPAEMFILTQRRRERRVHTEEYFSHRTDRAASAERCLHQLCQVVMEEGKAKSRKSQKINNLLMQLILFSPAEIAEITETTNE